MVGTDDEPGYEIERFVELKEDDCAQEEDQAFRLTVEWDGELTATRDV